MQKAPGQWSFEEGIDQDRDPSVRDVRVAAAAFRAAGFKVRGTLVSVGNLALRLVPVHHCGLTGAVTKEGCGS